VRRAVKVARGPGRLWVAVASEHRQAWAIRVGPRRVLVEYVSGTGVRRQVHVPDTAVTFL
jgi:hypothetical protein